MVRYHANSSPELHDLPRLLPSILDSPSSILPFSLLSSSYITIITTGNHRCLFFNVFGLTILIIIFQGYR